MAEQALPEAGGVIIVGGVAVEVAGLVGRIREAPTSRGASAIPEELLAAMERQDARPAAPLLEIDARTATRRGAVPITPVARLRPPAQRGDERESFALVVEEDGLLRWALPNPDGTIDVPLDPTPQDPAGDAATRGLVGGVIRKGIQWITAPLVDAVLGRIGEHFVRRWEERNRPHRLRLVGPDLTRLPDEDLTERQARDLLAGPTLLLVHGTISSTETGFAGLQPYLADLRRHYGNRVIAFDHPTLGFDPDENARWLAQRLRRLLDGRGRLTVDLLGHSRGGLVSRVLTERQQAIGLPPGLLEVRSVTFAGTPNAGTPLCDPSHLNQLVDTYTNLLALVPDGGVTDVMEVVVTVVKQLAAGFYSGLDGAMAMNPRGAWLRALNRPAEAAARYRAITADYEPPSGAAVARRLRDLVTDRVFVQEANDLVVPTDGTVGDNGSSLFPIATQLRLDPQPDSAVDHFRFFDHPDSVAQLKAWLLSGLDDVDGAEPRALPADPRPAPARRRRTTVAAADERVPLSAVDEALAAGDVARLRRTIDEFDARERHELETSIGAPLPRRDTTRGGRRHRRRAGTVIVLPGIMGSNLEVVDGTRVDRIWVHVWRLLTGQFPQLRYGTASVRPAGVYRVYIPLLLALDLHYEVVPFAYDWRQPLQQSAEALAARVRELHTAGAGPVHLVAHSMGGLVARHMIAAEPDPWRESGGRLVQLGTPNHGSFSIPLVLTGHERVVTWLALADTVSSQAEILDVVRGFPGVYQLLPSPGLDLDDDHGHLYDVRHWPDGLSADLLAQAGHAHEQLADAPRHADRLALVLGTDHPTAFRMRIEDGHFRYGRTVHGDGRVPHELARLDGVATYYSPADHGGLVVAPEVLDALPALLDGEEPERLPADDPARTRGVESETASLTLSAEELVPTAPEPRGADAALTLEQRVQLVTEITRDWLGTGSAPPTARTLEVGVVHGRLQHTDGPWLLGHVAGTPLSGSELALDRRVSGDLSRHHLVREYPEQVGEALVLDPADAGGDATVVVGLGAWGELTAPQLSESISRGVLRYLVSTRAARQPIIGLSTVLIGSSGDAGLAVHQSVTAVTEGVLAANRQAAVVRGAGGVAPAVERLRIVELYEEIALQAARAVRALPRELDPQSVGDTEVLPAPVLHLGRGGEPGQRPADYAADAWRRLVIRADDDQLVLTLLGRRAAAPQGSHGLLADVERLIGDPGRTPTTDPAWLTMLWHLLVPPELRSGLWGNLQLAVDERAAGLPWEMLATQNRLGEVQPLSLRAGMVRQLVDLEADTRLMSANQVTGGGRALVVGDPPTQRLPRLAGARREAAEVADCLQARGMDVQRLVYDESDSGDRSAEILAALYRQPWEIVHIAAHGEHDPVDPARSGVLLGPEQLLTGEHVAGLSSTPRLVVLNCCHLARLDRATVTVAGTPATRAALSRFAAGVAQSLMRQGVHAVVAAGWAVDDAPAALFATALYDHLLDGMAYGDAVRLARATTHKEHPGSATWGAYQCYGAAGFRIRRPNGSVDQPAQPVGAAELVREVERLGLRSTVLRPVEELRAELDDLLDAMPKHWRDRPDCAQAIGVACAERGDVDEAVTWYRRSVEHHDGVATVATIEQLANLQSRASTFDLAEVRRRLEWLLELGDTTERRAMLGAAYKRHAAALKSPNARRSNAERALEQYERALELGHDDLYVLPNVLQLEAVLGRVRPGGRERLARLVAAADRSGFHAAGSTGDRRLVEYLDGEESTIDEVRSAYVASLQAEPTHRQWSSVVEQVRAVGVLSEDEALIALADELAREPQRHRAAASPTAP